MAAATSYPSYYDTSPIAPPAHLDSKQVRKKKGSALFSDRFADRMKSPGCVQFNILHHLGNLSPWRTVNFGLKGTAQVPEGCTVQQVQLLHRYRLTFLAHVSGVCVRPRD